MSLTGYIGSLQKNILDPVPEHCKVVKLKSPVLNNVQFDLIEHLRYKGLRQRCCLCCSLLQGAPCPGESLHELCLRAEQAVDSGIRYIVLSDRA